MISISLLVLQIIISYPHWHANLEDCRIQCPRKEITCNNLGCSWDSPGQKKLWTADGGDNSSYCRDWNNI